MTTKYENQSLALRQEICKVSTGALVAIRKSDRVIEKLNKKLDKNVKMMKTGHCDESVENETNAVRQAVEVMSQKKIQLIMKSYDFIDQNIKGIDNEILLLEKALKETGHDVSSVQMLSNANLLGDTIRLKKRKHGNNKPRETDQHSLAADINEPVYCTCKRIAFGDMIACDNEDCPIEWFHYPCVNLTKPPKNAWVCPTCFSRRKK